MSSCTLKSSLCFLFGLTTFHQLLIFVQQTITQIQFITMHTSSLNFNTASVQTWISPSRVPLKKLIIIQLVKKLLWNLTIHYCVHTGHHHWTPIFIIKHDQSMFFPYDGRTSFTLTEKAWKDYTFVLYFNFCVLNWMQGDKGFWIE